MLCQVVRRICDSFRSGRRREKGTVACWVLALGFALQMLTLPLPTRAEDSSKPNPNGEIRQIMEIPSPESTMYGILKTDISNRLNKEIQDDFSQYIRDFIIVGGILLAGVGFFGLRTYAGLKGSVGEDVTNNLPNSDKFKKIVGERVSFENHELNGKVDSILHEMRLNSLAKLADKVESAGSFSNAERDDSFEGLMKLKDDQTIRKSATFLSVLAKVIDAFGAASVYHLLDEIEVEFRDIIQINGGMAARLFSAYAFQTLGDVYCTPELRERFTGYANACKLLRYYEVSLPFLMVLEHREKRAGWEDRVDGLMQDASFLTPGDRTSFIARLERYSDVAKFQQAPSAAGNRIAEAFHTFQSVYRVKLDKLFSERIAQPA